MSEKVEYRLLVGVNINHDTANTIRQRIVGILGRTDFGGITVLLSSEGGSTDASLALFNTISSLPVEVHMHAVGHVGSAAVPVFLAGQQRTCAPLSRFFFHEYDWGFNGRQTLHRIDEAIQRLRNDIEMARNIIQSRTDADARTLDALDGTGPSSILTANEAKSLGFVDEVMELEQTSRDGMKVAIWTV